MDLPERLRTMRVAAGFSQTALAAALNRNQQWVHNREAGHVRTKPDEALDWAEACGFRGALLFMKDGRPAELLELLQEATPEVNDLVWALLNGARHLTGPELRMIAGMVRIATDDRS